MGGKRLEPVSLSPVRLRHGISLSLVCALRHGGKVRPSPAAQPPAVTRKTLPLLDERLCLLVTVANSTRIYRNEQELWLHSPSAATEVLRPVLESWYRQQAWLYLPLRLRPLAEELGVRPSRITVRSQKTRWGSCSGSRTISLNWRLMLLPSLLVDYVLAHELCHLRHLNHSCRFWALLGTLIPDYRERRFALRQTKASLPF